jgi:DNA polymerase-4
LKISFSGRLRKVLDGAVHEAVRREDEIRRLAFSYLKRVDLMGKKVRLVGVSVSNLKKIAIVSPPV